MKFLVNGSEVTVEENQSLLRYLRDTLHITSAKDGCSEGACGTCTVLINGKAVRACTVKTGQLENASILTVEGLSDFEKEVYSFAFSEAGAVQCGFCIPGMVMCAKGLLDRNPDPSEEEIRHAIRHNICRCTGYVKIVRAIKMAGEIFREGKIPEKEISWNLGANVHRIDAKDKVLGRGIYPDDIYMEGMLHAVAVRSRYPRARVLAIHTEKAKEIPGVAAVFTAADIPGTIKVGHLTKDWDAMIPVGGITHFLGDAVALIAAETREIALKACELVKVDYEVLPCVRDPYEAMKEDAPLVHEHGCEKGNLFVHKHVSRGNVETALAGSDFVLSEKFSTPWTEHAFLEPECAVAYPDGDGVFILSADQGVYDTQRETAPMLGLPLEKVKVQNCLVGGGFGGKEDVTVQHLSALVAYLTKRPCKMKLSRAESLVFHPKRHPMDMVFTVGCDKNGIIQAVKASVIADTGAYASLGGPVLERACTHASGPYNYQNFEIDGYAYYTNNPPAGAFRGFGVTQTCFGIETMLNRLADKVGISHWEIRWRNAIRPGQELPNGQIVDGSTGLAQTLLAVKEEYESAKIAGIACAMKNSGVGVGLPDFGRVRLEVKDEKVIIHCGGSCIGQGVGTVLKQMVCANTGLPGETVIVEPANTFNAPDSGTTSGSRHTVVSGEAARRASLLFNEGRAGRSLKEMEGEEFYAEYLAKTDPLGADVPHPVSHVAYGYATQICILDEKNGKIRKMVGAHDIGVAVNPKSIEGQIEGGIVMGMGFALKEKFPIENCKPMAKYGSLGLFRADELPEIQSIVVEKEGLDVACGAIGLGEITCIPTAPAIADAYQRFDGIGRSVLPLVKTPYAYQKPESPTLLRPGKKLVINKEARCIGCGECVRACAKAFYKTDDAGLACLRLEERKGEPTPVVCTQCGKCERACPKGALTKNAMGVYVIDKKLCDSCGACRAACPLHVMPANPSTGEVSKCIACGLCVKACPMDVLLLGTWKELNIRKEDKKIKIDISKVNYSSD